MIHKNLLIIGFISLLNTITLAAIIPILYIYAYNFNLNDFYIGLLFAIFPLAQFIATPIIGKLSDIYGRKPLLMISLFGTFIASIIQAFTPNSFFLFLGRFINGMTSGTNSVAGAVIYDVTDEKNRSFGFALLGASLGLGFVIGPIISIILSKNFEINSIFIFSGLLALIAVFITQILLPETNKYSKKKEINLFELIFLQNLYALRKPIIREILILALVIAITSATFQIGIQPYVFNNFGWSQEVVSYIFSFLGLVNTFCLGIVKIVINKFGEKKIILLLQIFTFFIFLSISLLINKYIFFITMLLFSFVNLLNSPVISTLITKYTRKEDQGAMQGVLQSIFSLGLTLGPLLFSITSTLTSIINGTNFSMINKYSLPFFLLSIINFISLLYCIKFIIDLKHKYTKNI